MMYDVAAADIVIVREVRASVQQASPQKTQVDDGDQCNHSWNHSSIEFVFTLSNFESVRDFSKK